VVVVGVIAAGLLAIVGLAAIAGSSDDPYPDAWDPRIEPLARFVEKERGLPFHHPVYVDFLDKAAFDAQASEGGGPTDAERAELDKYTGLYRAFGLLRGDVDLFDAGNELASDGVAAYYSSETKRVTVNGPDLDAATKVTVVHELTHAWQDQHFDLLGVETGLDNVTSETYTAMVEGDAVRIETRYYEQLSAAEQAEVDQGENAGAEEADWSRFPRVIVSEFSAPYAFGPPFVNALSAVRGDTAVDQAITSPPKSYEQVLDPFAYLDGDAPTAVLEPTLRAGEERFDGGTLGALLLYLVLNERVGTKRALAAADGWQGDAYVAFTRDARTCVRADVRAESDDALARLSDAIGIWASAMPTGTVNWIADTALHLESCDPGADAAIPDPVEPDVDPLLGPSVRLQIIQGALESGLEPDRARCFAFRYFDSLGLQHLTAEDDRLAAEIDTIASNAASSCG
jgi:hypothetical protein